MSPSRDNFISRLARAAAPGVSGGSAHCPSSRCPLPTDNRHRGFSFVEILFAIFVLGIGLMMIAAVFPVAIQQSQATMEEATGRVVVDIGRRYMEAVMDRANSPETGGLVTFDPAWPALSMVQGNRILSSDPRFAWVPFYKRNPNSNIAEVYIIPLQARNRPSYQPGDVRALYPRPTEVDLIDMGPGQIDQIRMVKKPPSPALDARELAAEGAWVLVRNGRALRMGSPVNAADGTWELAAGSEIGPADATLDMAYQRISGRSPLGAYIVGRGVRNPMYPPGPDTNPYEGYAQDVNVPQIGPFPVVLNPAP